MGVKSGLMVTISVRKSESLAFKERMPLSLQLPWDVYVGYTGIEVPIGHGFEHGNP